MIQLRQRRTFVRDVLRYVKLKVSRYETVPLASRNSLFRVTDDMTCLEVNGRSTRTKFSGRYQGRERHNGADWVGDSTNSGWSYQETSVKGRDGLGKGDFSIYTSAPSIYQLS